MMKLDAALRKSLQELQKRIIEHGSSLLLLENEAAGLVPQPLRHL
jgi:hypothetical protein